MRHIPTKEVSIVPLITNNVHDENISEMLCTRIGIDEDASDILSRKTIEIAHQVRMRDKKRFRKSFYSFYFLLLTQ